MSRAPGSAGICRRGDWTRDGVHIEGDASFACQISDITTALRIRHQTYLWDLRVRGIGDQISRYLKEDFAPVMQTGLGDWAAAFEAR